jgi:hypothetical protein
VTVAAVAVKAADVAPAGTVTDAGTGSAAALLDDNATVLPPAGAGALNVTIQVVEAPAVRLEGAQTSEEAAGPPPPAGAA